MIIHTHRKPRLMKWTKILLLGGMLLVLVFAVITGVAGMYAKSELAKQYPPPGQLVDIGGYSLHIHCVGYGSPTIIMDSGLNEFSVQWVEIQSEVSKYGRACSYDRAGFGWSEAGLYPRTSETIIKELHTLLEKARIEGPYVLVGHSFGGMNMRLYAHHFPSEVIGMVLVDAAHEGQSVRVPALQKASEQVLGQFRLLARLTSLGLLALSPNDIPDRGLSGETLAQYRAILATTDYFDTAIAETEALDKSFSEVRAAKINSLGNIPLIVLSRGLSDPLPDATEIENRQYEQSWKEMQVELVALSQKGKQIVAMQSKHYIHLTQPQLVIDAIRNVATHPTKLPQMDIISFSDRNANNPSGSW